MNEQLTDARRNRLTVMIIYRITKINRKSRIISVKIVKYIKRLIFFSEKFAYIMISLYICSVIKKERRCI